MEDSLLAEHAEREAAQLQANARVEQNAAIVMAPPAPPPLYDPMQIAALGTNGAAEPAGVAGFLTRKFGPLPTWAWLLVGTGVAGGGYYWWRYKSGNDVKKNGDDEKEPELGQRMPLFANGSSSGHEDDDGGGWGPSRSAFAEKLTTYFDKKGLSPHVTVWHDAEDARDKGKMRIISPLINVQVKDPKAVKVDVALQRWARREGLNPVQHQDGTIGFYPHTGKRGKAWESYVDSLRDDGQTV